MRSLLRSSLPAALLALATGCASVNPPPPVEVLATTPPPLSALSTADAAPANGSLFSSQRYRPPLEDPRARLVGDMVTITIKEKISASQNSNSNVSRKPKVSGGITALPFVGGDIEGKTKIGAEFSNTFDGGGKTSSENKFESSITATVTEVLPNGHLVITGEKQVGVNRSVDVLRFSGTIDPRRIAPGNTIDSQYVANVRVISRGMGEQAEAQAMGWLGRFFNTITPF
ncbi:flagellar basal body L-ring protein FlgH [Acidovorax sp. HDW3]|uniref:flagellar basal body L-ring protein FlgH n=1 Tax=Acidovorax sp. HDW3 TaxID=2714923 RepID=UPI00140DF451|nr:flagellar basal body L-ring protein FlgH [Acidovorax sp. HDW3]QIL45110.1 flagellar basal body L-ring protein FlgH [Acidovorax sp. HDW3]